MAIQKFHLGDILSITTERLLSPRGMTGVYEILNFMTGDNLFTTQLSRAKDECKPYLLEAMPWLSQISAEKVNTENYSQWIKEQVGIYGELHEVRSIHPEDHEVLSPEEELRRMFGDKKSIFLLQLRDDPELPDQDEDSNRPKDW